MPITPVLLNVPQEAVPAEKAGPYLKDFVLWLREFLGQIAENHHEVDESTGRLIFEESQIIFLVDALRELDERGHFENVIALIDRAKGPDLSAHGLEGVQLNWKLSNINFWLDRFLGKRTAELLERLLASVDALLKSLLGAVGAGEALEELKEAVRNSMALVTKE